jgi:hypothetical protein
MLTVCHTLICSVLYEATVVIYNRVSNGQFFNCVKQISTGALFELQLLFVMCEEQSESKNRTNDSK